MFDVQRSTFFKKSLPILVVWSLFALCLAAPWLWFHFPASDNNSTPGIRFSATTNVTSMSFSPELLSESVLRLLAYPHYVNGSYKAIDGKIIRLFLVDWNQKIPHNLDVMRHTPDVCWVSSGWVPVTTISNTSLTLNVIETKLVFQSRVFATPSEKNHELVIWAALIGGRTVAESPPSKYEHNINLPHIVRSFWARRRLDLYYLWRGISKRDTGDRSMQYIRLSTPISKVNRESITEISNYLVHLIEQQVIVTVDPMPFRNSTH
jgi:hypothetical protein